MKFFEASEQVNLKPFENDDDLLEFLGEHEDSDLLILDGDGEVVGIVLNSIVDAGFAFIKLGVFNSTLRTFSDGDRFIEALQAGFDCTSAANFARADLAMSYTRK